MDVEHREQPRQSLVLWKGKQWLVTSEGVETIGSQPRLVIRKEILCRLVHPAAGIKAVRQTFRSLVFDTDEFVVAWNEALRLHRSDVWPRRRQSIGHFQS